MIFSCAVDRLAWIGHPNRQSDTKMSLYVESYQNVWNVFAYRYSIVTVKGISSGAYIKIKGTRGNLSLIWIYVAI